MRSSAAGDEPLLPESHIFRYLFTKCVQWCVEHDGNYRLSNVEKLAENLREEIEERIARGEEIPETQDIAETIELSDSEEDAEMPFFKFCSDRFIKASVACSVESCYSAHSQNRLPLGVWTRNSRHCTICS